MPRRKRHSIFYVANCTFYDVISVIYDVNCTNYDAIYKTQPMPRNFFTVRDDFLC